MSRLDELLAKRASGAMIGWTEFSELVSLLLEQRAAAEQREADLQAKVDWLTAIGVTLDWKRVNRRRGQLISRDVDGTATDAEQRELVLMQSLADRRVDVFAPFQLEPDATEAILRSLTDDLDRLQKTIRDAYAISVNAPELNMSNYDEDQVIELTTRW